MSRSYGYLLAASLALAGCNQAAPQDAQYDDSRNPFYQKAQQALDNNDPAAAAGAYEDAIAANPKLQTAQYQLGVLYGEKLQDPVNSIYHFRQFLALAPNSDHAVNAKDKIDKDLQQIVASQPAANNSADLAKLQSDNATLQKQVAEATRTIEQLQAQLARESKHHNDAVAATPPPAPETPGAPVSPSVPGVPPATPIATDAGTPLATDGSTPPASASTAPASPPRALPLDAPDTALTPIAPGTPVPPGETPPAPVGPSRSYTVAKGDSLWKIAHKMYPGDTKNGVDKIQEANKDAIGGKPLKIGQVLVIPQ